MLWLVWMLNSAGCATSKPGNEFFCPPDLTYKQDGQPDLDGYRVEKECYKSMTRKLSACYDDTK